MELALQCGYGMMSMNLTLMERWRGGTVILSPRDLNADQLRRHSEDVRRMGGTIWLDPQFYLPHADHERLCSHSYWPASYATSGFWTGGDLPKLVRDLHELNGALQTSDFVLPGLFAAELDDDWLLRQRAIVDQAAALERTRPLVHTIALSADVVRNEDQMHELLEATAEWPVDGYYLVCEHPDGTYLVDDALWLANQLDLVAGLRLRGLRVTIGYCTHQLLSASVAHATRIASGSWLNVRSFPPEKFQVAPDQERRMATWYYCPHALSEYKVTMLDVAHTLGALESMAPQDGLRTPESEKLFRGIQPSTVGFSQSPDAFQHYLHCVHEQAAGAVKGTYDETLAAQRQALDNAERTLDEFSQNSIAGQDRDFSRVLAATRAALTVFDRRRGPIMRRRWAGL